MLSVDFCRDKETGDFTVGRIAVLKEYRGQNIGTKGSESRRGSHKEREGQQNLSSRTIAGKGF